MMATAKKKAAKKAASKKTSSGPTKAMVAKAIGELNKKILEEPIDATGDVSEMIERIKSEVELYDTDQKQLSEGCWGVLTTIGIEVKEADEGGEDDGDETPAKPTSKKAAKKKAVSKKPAAKAPAKPKEKKIGREEAICRVIQKTTKKAGATVDDIAGAANDILVKAGGKDNLNQTAHITRCVLRGTLKYMGLVEEVTKDNFRYVG